SIGKAIEDQLEYWEKQKKIAEVQKQIAEARIEIQRQKKEVRVHRDSVGSLKEEVLAKLVKDEFINSKDTEDEDGVNDDGPEKVDDNECQFTMEDEEDGRR